MVLFYLFIQYYAVLKEIYYILTNKKHSLAGLEDWLGIVANESSHTRSLGSLRWEQFSIYFFTPDYK